MYHIIGTPCNKNKGYCDVFYRCRGADPDSPLARLSDCFSSGKCGEHILYILRVSLTYFDQDFNQ